MKPIIAAFFLSFSAGVGQTVENTSTVTESGERVLQLEIVVPLSQLEAWKLFSTEEGLKKWIAPVVFLDLRAGGVILTNYDSSKTVKDSGTIRLPIINYLEGEMLTLKVVLNNHFTESVRREDGNLQEIIRLKNAGDGKTRIISSMVGWGKGSDWDKTYEFFRRGNTWTYQQMMKAIQSTSR
jgi:hypothetical protein